MGLVSLYPSGYLVLLSDMGIPWSLGLSCCRVGSVLVLFFVQTSGLDRILGGSDFLTWYCHVNLHFFSVTDLFIFAGVAGFFHSTCFVCWKLFYF